jgi:GT2 family glycosyltransferase
MRLAFAAAMAEDFDRYLWWNDDTVLADDAIDRMVACARLVEAQAGSTIVVGTTCDPITGARTYGGWKKRFAGLRVSFDPVEPRADQPVSIDTMNGNVVLIPAAIAKAVGNLEPRFRHRLADMDYGQRAVKAGFAVVLAPGCLGTCAANSDRKTWRDGRMPLTARWQDLMSPRGSEPKEWLLYTSRHYGWRWPLYFVSPYVKVLFKGMTARK